MDLLTILSLVWEWAALALLPFNWAWDAWSKRERMCVPGSLQQHHARAMCRRVRYPGFLFNPVLMLHSFGWVWAAPLWAKLPVALLSLLMVSATVEAWRRLRRQIEEDDDDPWNKGKRAAKRAAGAARRAAKSIRIPSPMPAPVGGAA